MPGVEEKINLEHLAKVDLRIATITAAVPITGANRLLKLIVDLGDKQCCLISGIKELYPPGELVGKQVVVVVNLEPRTIKGEVSEGMLLAVDMAGKTVLLQPDKPVPPGSKVI